MARIETRVRKDGKTKTYRVQWRLGGSRNGEWQSETFDQKARAVTFKLAVEACGHDWPEGWIRGYGWAPATPDPVVEPEAAPILFRDYATNFVASLSGIEERTRHDYQRDLRNHILPTFGDHDIRDGTTLDRALVRVGQPAPARRPRPRQPQPVAPAPARTQDDPEPARRPVRHPARRRRGRSPATDLQLRRAHSPAPPGRRRGRRRDGVPHRAGVRLDPRLRQTGRARHAHRLRRHRPALRRTRRLAGTRYRPVRQAVPTLRVRRAWKRQADNTFKVGPPKTKQSRRTIALSSEVMDAILLNIAGKGPKEFVFNSPTGSWWRHSSFYDRRWIPAIDDACSRGLTKRPRIHDLIDAIDRALTGSLRAVA